MRRYLSTAAWVVLALAGCASGVEEGPGPRGQGGDSDGGDSTRSARGEELLGRADGPSFTESGEAGPVVAEVGEAAVGTSEVLAYLLKKNPGLFQEVVNELLLRHLVASEAKRLSVELREEEVSARLAQTLESEEKAAREHVQVQYQMTLEEFLAEDGSDLARFLKEQEEKYRHEMPYELQLERVVRFWTLTTGSIEASRIVVDDRKKAEVILGKVREGASFSQIAKGESIDAFAKEGGKLPRIYSHDDIGKMRPILSAMKAGEVSDIIEEGEGQAWSIYLVSAVHPSRDVSFEEIEDEVLATLREKGLTLEEIQKWYLMKVQRHEGVKRHYDLPQDLR